MPKNKPLNKYVGWLIIGASALFCASQMEGAVNRFGLLLVIFVTAIPNGPTQARIARVLGLLLLTFLFLCCPWNALAFFLGDPYP